LWTPSSTLKHWTASDCSVEIGDLNLWSRRVQLLFQIFDCPEKIQAMTTAMEIDVNTSTNAEVQSFFKRVSHPCQALSDSDEFLAAAIVADTVR
jgi:hypothetical protein